VGSTLAFQALTPINLAKRNLFWTTPHPTGIQGTPVAGLIDIDEAGAASACHCHVLPSFLLPLPAGSGTHCPFRAFHS
jgi:hypothetical protein